MTSDTITAVGNVTSPTVQVGALKTMTLSAANTESLVIATRNGADVLTVDSSASPFLVPIVYDGGTGVDSLILTGGLQHGVTDF